MVDLGTDLLGHDEVWRAPKVTISTQSCVRILVWDTSDVVGNLSKCSQSSNWFAFLVKRKETLVRIRDLTEIQREQMLVGKLIDSESIHE